MRRIVLAALLAAVALPAWAYNEDKADTEIQAFGICLATGTSSAICWMKHESETSALRTAQVMIDACWKAKHREFPAYRVGYEECPKILAYIKQRWGY